MEKVIIGADLRILIFSRSQIIDFSYHVTGDELECEELVLLEDFDEAILIICPECRPEVEAIKAALRDAVAACSTFDAVVSLS